MDQSIDQTFWEYHEDNPEIFELFKQYAHAARDAGMSRYSARAIFHRIRWHIDIETHSNDGFKLSNNHTPRYARMLMATDAAFLHFFVLRRLTTYSSLSFIDDLLDHEEAKR